MIDLINLSIAGSLPTGGVEDQEAQMDDTELGKVTTRGYKRRGAAAATPGAGGLDALKKKYNLQ